MCALHRHLRLLALAFVVMQPVGQARAGSVDDLYGFKSYDGYATDPTMYKLSIPTKKIAGTATEVPVVRAIVCVYPGMGGSGIASPANDIYARWAYENGIAFWNVGPVWDPAADTIFYLGETATRISRPELANAPLITTGESSGAYSAFDVANSYPNRVLAVYGQHKGNSGGFTPAVTCPTNVTFGEFDSSRLEIQYPLHLSVLQTNSANGGGPWAMMTDRGMLHTQALDYREDMMHYVETIIPYRYTYTQGVSGKDPAIGAVTLNAINVQTTGWRGEHLLSPNDPTKVAAGTLHYSLITKDWDSANLKVAPVAEFDRANPHLHSWFPNASLAYAWRSRAGLGARQMRFSIQNAVNNHYFNDGLTPSLLNSDQTTTASLETGAFTTANKVEFYDNGTRVATTTLPPYEHTYAWSSGDAGWHTLYAVATDTTTGEQRVSGSRSVRIFPKTVGANTAPTISPIADQSVSSGTATVAIPFTIGDAETAATALTVKYYKASSLDHSNIDEVPLAYSSSITGTGTSRTLTITLTDTTKSGAIWGYLQVHDGEMQVNQYVRMNITPTSSLPPQFVVGQTFNTTGTSTGKVVYNGGWSKEISFRVFDADTPAEDLSLSVSSATTSKIPLTNIIFGGYGEFRTVKIKCDGTTGSIMTFTLSDGVNAPVTHTYNPSIGNTTDAPPLADTTPIINNIGNITAYSGDVFNAMARVYDQFTASEPIGAHPKLTVTATSSNQTILPDANIIVATAGAERRISGTTAAGQAGNVTVTVTVTDAQAKTATDTFTVTVSASTVPPAITQQPSSQIIQGGTTASLSLVASGGGPYTYQWYEGATGNTATPISGADSSSYTSPTLSATASYWVRVTNASGSADSTTATVTLLPASISSQPQNKLVLPNAPATLSVTASGGAPYAYQWYQGNSGDTGTPISGATSATYTTPNLSTPTSYWVRVNNSVGGENSSTATVSFIIAPAITAQPLAKQIYTGQSTTLTVASSGTPLAYQWYLGTSGTTTSPISGATTNAYTTSALTSGASYWVRISNSAGTADSNTAAITIQNSNWSAYHDMYSDADGNHANVSNGSNSTTAYTLKDFSTGSAMSGKTIAFTTAGTVTALTTGALGASGTDAYNLFSGIIGIGAKSTKIAYGGTCAVKFTGLDPAKRYRVALFANRNQFDNSTRFSMQTDASEYVNSGSSGATLTDTDAIITCGTNTANGYIAQWHNIKPVGTSGSFTVQVANGATTGDFILPQAILLQEFDYSVVPTAISAQPGSPSIGNGDTADLSVTATGTTLSYQWYEGTSGTTTNPVSGATSASFTTPSLTATTSYWVRVTGANGTVDSNTATVTVAAAAPTAISSQPAGASIAYNATANLSVTATGTTLSYLWYEGTSGTTTNPVSGATSASFTTPSLAATTSYWVRVTGANGTVDSDAATVTVAAAAPTAISSQPAGASIAYNATANLSVTATGTTLSYQWYEGTIGMTTNPVIGATSASFTTPSLTATTTYWVRATGANGTVDSDAATVSVAAPVPEMDVVGVADGGTPSVSSTTAGIGKAVSYTINNSGNGALTITGNATVTNLVNCSVTVNTQPSGSVEASGSTTLALTVTPTAGGAWSFDVALANNDSNENPYDWSVSGTAVAVAADHWVTTLLDSGADATLDTDLATDTTDGGGLSLREAIGRATAGQTIGFSVSGTIQLGAELLIAKNLTIHGGDTIALDGMNASRIFYVYSSGSALTVTLKNMTLTRGGPTATAADMNGGAIYNFGESLTLDFVTLISNTATATATTLNTQNGQGGALSITGSTASTTVRYCTFSDNTASATTGTTASNGYGGAIFISGGPLTIVGSTFNGNVATGPATGAADGGAIYSTSSALIQIVESNFSGNTADDMGGALYLNNGTSNIYNSTFTGNTGATADGGGIQLITNTMALYSTIIAGNTPLDLDSNVAFTSTDSLYDSTKIVGTHTPTAGYNLNGASPMLDALADNGGPTDTCALQTGSPALDIGSTTAATTAGFDLTYDQRGGGFARSIGAGVDIGSFEKPASATPPSISAQPSGSTIANGATATLSVTATGTTLTYQWYEGAIGTTTALVNGATSADFTTPALTAPTSYWVRVSNAGGSVDSQAAAITVLTPLQTWAASHSLSGLDAAADADPDGDGVVNLMEFALGNSPTNPSQGNRPSASMPAADTLGLTFRRATAGLRYIVESSTTLAAGSWTAELVIEKNTDPATVGQDVLAEIPMGGATKKFVRLRVVE